MKIFLFLVSLFNLFTLSNTYQTKLQEFESIINNSYEEYVVIDHSSAVGDLYIAVGGVDDELSFSIYFKNISYPKYQVQVVAVKSSPKEYILSEFEDYQIFYNISVKKNTKYYVELINEETKQVYNRYYVVGKTNLLEFDSSLIINGKGTNNFPYETKLSTKLSFFQVMGIIIGVIILIEIILSFFIYLRRKNKKKKQDTHTYIPKQDEEIFDYSDYVVKDNQDEN